MHMECFGIAGNGKTENICSRILTEIIVNMSVMIINLSVKETCSVEWLIFVLLLRY